MARTMDHAVTRNRAGYAFVGVATNRTPGGAGQVFQHLANIGTTDIEVLKIRVVAAAAETVVGTLGADSAIINNTVALPINLDRGFTSNTSGLVDHNTGTNIATLGTSQAIGYMGISAAQGTAEWEPVPRIIIPPGSALWLGGNAGAVALWSSIEFVVKGDE
mgnify:FL=1